MRAKNDGLDLSGFCLVGQGDNLLMLQADGDEVSRRDLCQGSELRDASLKQDVAQVASASGAVT